MGTTEQEEKWEGNAVPSNEQMLDFDDSKGDDVDLQGQQAVEQRINHTQDLTEKEDMQENINSIIQQGDLSPRKMEDLGVEPKKILILWFGAIPIRLLSPRLVDIAHLTGRLSSSKGS
ncbi:hypothetical protein HAX54_041360 [Datura stramonium]|uniref:Uncharacterized protein n=1 Tax=Datura stramonium TaxID=4076 RepID=A0ABS8VP07_DATST|nr:hypothetical protein [Datura stramonium]